MTTETRSVAPKTDPKSNKEGVVDLSFEENGLALLRLGAPSERIVTLTEERMASLGQAISRLAEHPGLSGVILTGPGPGMFAAGADIKLFSTITEAREGEAAAVRGRTLFARLLEIQAPVVCAIEGPCLGGGLELALCCDLRIASLHPATRIGLPEVKLGIVPGFGGTQRLSRLLGLPLALDLILTGRLLDARGARRRGLVDRAVPAEHLLAAAREEISKLGTPRFRRRRRKLRGKAFWLSRTPLRGLVARTARKRLETGPGRFYPAPRRALELCLDAFRLPRAEGFVREARALGEMIVTEESRSLVRLFFLTEHSKGLGKDPHAREIHRALVLGGGAMGAGIAGLMARHDIRVRLCDLDPKALARARRRLQETLDKRLRRRRMQRNEAQAAQDRLAVATEWGQLGRYDLVLEAVVEDAELKRKLFAQACERGLPDEAMLATNTSSLSIDEMASGLPDPSRLIGVHFFNPPEKMPLVEVIRGQATSEKAVATACKLAVELGKYPVVVRDAPGFLINRCLAPYLNEAVLLLLEGNEPEHLDRALLGFGMPMGPARLLDEVGWDVAEKVSRVIAQASPHLGDPPPLLAAMVEAGALGVKAGGGLYGPSGRGSGPGRRVLAGLRKTQAHQQSEPTPADEIVRRLIHLMINEAYRCLEQGIVEGEDDIDLGMVFGIGFPPFRGGLTRHARNLGLPRVAKELQELATRHGPRFSPCGELGHRGAE